MIPKYTKPDILPVEVTMNGKDFTNDKVSYGFYDAFVLDVQPRLISKRGGTKMTIKGFGFVDSGNSEISAKFGTLIPNDDITCAGHSTCTTPAKFVDKHTITTDSLPQSSLAYRNQNRNIGEDPMTVEVSVYGDSYTENDIQVYYIYDPDFKSVNRPSVIRNMQVPLLIETDFHWQNNDKEMFFKHGNFTCRFTLHDHQITTVGRMETMPLGSGYTVNGEAPPLPDHIVCPSPKMPASGMGKLEISANGVDYEGPGFPFEFLDSADVYRISPQSGPKDASTHIKFIGSGLRSTSPLYAKVGNFDLEPIERGHV